MVRTVKDYDERYNEFLDVSQTLFFTQGYEATSVQHIIRAVGVAKGTFYHYFDTKTDLLQAIVIRMVEQITVVFDAIIADDSLDAVQKLEQFFAQSNQWKVERKSAMLATARLLFDDQNVLLREKLQEQSATVFVPILAQIIQQGMQEGVFDVVHPVETAELILFMPQTMGRRILNTLLSDNRTDEEVAKLHRELAVLTTSIERVLGMASGTLVIFGDDLIEHWLSNES